MQKQKVFSVSFLHWQQNYVKNNILNNILSDYFDTTGSAYIPKAISSLSPYPSILLKMQTVSFNYIKFYILYFET